MILEARDVTFYYPGRRKTPILENFSMTVEDGERVGLKAPSGRGKTTLCRLLAGYEKPRKGEILLDGRLLSGHKGACPVQMVWQHPETVVDPLLRLRDTLAEAGGIDPELQRNFISKKGGWNGSRRNFPEANCRGSALRGRLYRGHVSSCVMRSLPCWIW